MLRVARVPWTVTRRGYDASEINLRETSVRRKLTHARETLPRSRDIVVGAMENCVVKRRVATRKIRENNFIWSITVSIVGSSRDKRVCESREEDEERINIATVNIYLQYSVKNKRKDPSRQDTIIRDGLVRT